MMHDDENVYVEKRASMALRNIHLLIIVISVLRDARWEFCTNSLQSFFLSVHVIYKYHTWTWRQAKLLLYFLAETESEILNR